MPYTREEVIARLLKSYEAYYNITLFEDPKTPIRARCDYFEHAQKYVVSKKQSFGRRTVKNFYTFWIFRI